MTTETFADLERVLEKYRGPKYMDCLRPGLPAHVVREALERAGLQSCEELENIYGWRNGFQAEGWLLTQMYLAPCFLFISLEDSVSSHQNLMDSGYWNESWFPIFKDDGGDYAVIDIQGREGNSIQVIRHEESEPTAAFESIPDMIATFRAAYETGAFLVDENTGSIDADFGLYKRLAASMNPNCPAWTVQ